MPTSESCCSASVLAMLASSLTLTNLECLYSAGVYVICNDFSDGAGY